MPTTEQQREAARDLVERGREHLSKAWRDDVADIMLGKELLDHALVEVDCLRAAAREMLKALEEELAAGDALTAFLLASDPKVMGEAEWRAGHAERSQRRRNAISACHNAIAAAKAAGIKSEK